MLSQSNVDPTAREDEKMSEPVVSLDSSTGATDTPASKYPAAADELSQGAGPLDGIRVLELGTAIAGPYVAELLHLLGADVIKIERHQGGDPIRQWASDRGPLPFVQMNAGKRSLALDLKNPHAPDVLKRFIANTDVFVHNLKPGALERMGLGGTECLEINPRLVYLAISGFGGVGPMGTRPAYDSAGQALGGLLGLLAGGGRPSVGPSLADLATGVVALSGVLAGLVQVARNGQGVVVETSLVEGATALIADLFAHQQMLGGEPNFQTRARQSQVFTMQTAGGGYIVIHVSTSQVFFESLMRAVGRSDLIQDERFKAYRARVQNFEQLYAELEPVFSQRTADEWQVVLGEHSVPNSPVLGLGEMMEHPQFEALELFRDTEPTTGMRLVGPPWRFDGRRLGKGRRSFGVGEHSREVLAAIFQPEELSRLVDEGIVELP